MVLMGTLVGWPLRSAAALLRFGVSVGGPSRAFYGWYGRIQSASRIERPLTAVLITPRFLVLWKNMCISIPRFLESARSVAAPLVASAALLRELVSHGVQHCRR